MSEEQKDKMNCKMGRDESLKDVEGLRDASNNTEINSVFKEGK